MMARHRTYPYLQQLENDTQLQARIDAVEARVQRTFELPAHRLLAYLGKQQRNSLRAAALEDSGRWRL